MSGNKQLHTIGWIVGFPFLIMGESMMGMPALSLLFTLVITFRLRSWQRLWWWLYVSAWIALWYHTWWWQVFCLVGVGIISTQLVKKRRWVYVWILAASLGCSVMLLIVSVVPFVQVNQFVVSSLVVVQVVVLGLVWGWLWRRDVLHLAAPWYIR